MNVVKRLTLYPAPLNRDEFHHRYEDELWPLAGALPGCLKCRVTVPIEPGDRPYHVIGELYFSDAETLRLALESPIGERFISLERDISTGGSLRHDLCIEHETLALEDR